MLILKQILIITMVVTWTNETVSQRQFSKKKILELREEVRAMFQHAYNGYLQYASGYDELRPLTCDGIDTWGSYSLTLVDALDTLATMGNYSEFRRVAKLLEHKMNFDRDINVSVFETNIRIVGGLMGAHMLSKQAGVEVENGWPCTGPLLRMAEDVARRLLPAFDTSTGMPYGTVNLRHGVPRGETPITCTAGVGTFLVEFGALSRLTGNSIYEEVALNAVHALWEHRSAIGLFGNHIDVQTGRWTAQDAGIGAGVDSFYEYLVKGALLLNRPNLLEMFHEARAAIDKYLKRDDWYVWAGMHKGQITLPVFQSLEAYWPGVLSIIGDIKPAIRTMSKYNSVWKQYGFLPEFYNIPAGEASANRESYPLRPELAESAMYLYRATKNQFLLEVGENMLRSIEYSAKTPCGYATIRNVLTHEQDNRMESFFLAETTKYLYLLFDEDNFLHNDGRRGDLLQTPNGQCVVHAGAYIFNTEAHPIDMSALFCCHDIHEANDMFEDFDIDSEFNEMFIEAERQERDEAIKKNAKKYSCNSPLEGDVRKAHMKNQDTKISIDIEVFDENDAPAADELIRNFERVRHEKESEKDTNGNNNVATSQLTVADLNDFFNARRVNFSSADHVLEFVVTFLKKFTLDQSQIHGLQIFDKTIASSLGSTDKDDDKQSKTLWELYQLKPQYAINVQLIDTLGVAEFEDENDSLLYEILEAINMPENPKKEPKTDIEFKVLDARTSYEKLMVNTTAMQDFVLRILINGTADKNRTFQQLLSEQEIIALGAVKSVSGAAVDIFDKLRKVIKFKQRLIHTLKELQTVSEENKSVLKNNIRENLLYDKPMIEETTASELLSNAKKSTTKTPSSAEDSDDSIWSQLVQTILRTTKSTPRVKFDADKLLEKTRTSLSQYANVPQNFSVFTCSAEPFISRFAYREFYP